MPQKKASGGKGKGKAKAQQRQRPPPSQFPKGAAPARPRGRAKTQKILSSGNDRSLGGNAPLQQAFALPRSYLSIGGQPQTNCDLGHCPAIRISGGDVSFFALGAKAATGDFGIAPTVSAACVANFVVTPRVISDRLRYMVSMYTSYAFRKLRFVFIPLVGPSNTLSAASVAASSVVAVSLNQDAGSTYGADGPQNLQQVCQNSPSTLFPAWRGGALTYEYDGTKCWFTSNNNDWTGNPDVSDFTQLAISARWFDSNGSVTSGQITHLIHVEYVIDCYRPQEPDAYPSVRDPLARPRLVREELDEKTDSVYVHTPNVPGPPASPASRRGSSQPPASFRNRVG